MASLLISDRRKVSLQFLPLLEMATKTRLGGGPNRLFDLHVEEDHPVLHRLQHRTKNDEACSDKAKAPVRQMIGQPLDKTGQCAERQARQANCDPVTPTEIMVLVRWRLNDRGNESS
jgi:hypothetical protein